MFCIILYHLIIFFVEPNSHHVFWKAIQIPLHSGVIIFILISGYFGIRTSLKGIINIIFTLFLIYYPLETVRHLIDPTIEWKNSIMCLTRGPYWFILQYLILYLLSPILNLAVEKSKNLHIYTLVVLGIITYYGGLVGPEIQMINGKNIFLFSFLYMFGRYINIYKTLPIKLGSFKHAIITYLAMNVLLISAFIIVDEQLIRNLIIKLFFTYPSVGLLGISLLLFASFEQINITSSFINSFSKSTLSMYIFHHHPLMLNVLYAPIIAHLTGKIGYGSLLMVSLILLTITTMIVSWGGYKIIGLPLSKIQSFFKRHNNDFLEFIK